MKTRQIYGGRSRAMVRCRHVHLCGDLFHPQPSIVPAFCLYPAAETAGADFARARPHHGHRARGRAARAHHHHQETARRAGPQGHHQGTRPRLTAGREHDPERSCSNNRPPVKAPRSRGVFCARLILRHNLRAMPPKKALTCSALCRPPVASAARLQHFI